MSHKLFWFEAKQLDRVTNYSTELEMIKNYTAAGGDAHYFCTFCRHRAYYGMEGRIHYLGWLKNRYLKFVEFNILTVLCIALLVCRSRRAVFMVNQNLTWHLLPGILLNAVLRRKNRFVVDIRTLPESVGTDSPAMKKYYRQFGFAAKHCDGFSFIAPFIREISIKPFPQVAGKPSVFWSSGVDVAMFDPDKCDYRRHADEPFRIFYHGGTSISRGNFDLIRACEKLVAEGTRLELVQVGVLVNPELLEYVERHNIGSWCRIEPPRPLSEMPGLIARCDLPVMPFPRYMIWRTSSPIKMMEYLAMGKPMLCSDLECFTDVFPADSPLVSYFHAESHDNHEALAAAIKRIIDSTVLSDRHIYAPEGREFVRKYTWEQQVGAFYRWTVELTKA